MAGASSGEEENYWPGYVDALTTMLMVLTFVMMVLGIVVFTLSQNVSKNIVSAIAAAVDIDAGTLSPGTPEGLRQAVVAALKEKLAQPQQRQPEPQPPAPPAPPEREPVAPVQLPTFASGQAMLPAALPATAADTPATPAAPLAPDLGAPTVAATIPSQEGSAAGAGRDTIIQDGTPSAAAAPDRKTLVDAGDGLRILFSNGAVQLDQAGAIELDAYARSVGTGSFVVRASAFLADAGATDARRRAFYRAMLVRQRLLQAGVKADQIVVQVRDDEAPGSQNLVHVMGRTGPAPQ